ncbi:hypothetical protein GMA12_11265 [Kocuria sediminis]|uniref:Esterase n=1 Tax=Kocuria sediminis TaxID=1038857 RepID=A0A6N8GKS6_9MICC|nr:hypothetical protein [Kocuria sediminis]
MTRQRPSRSSRRPRRGRWLLAAALVLVLALLTVLTALLDRPEPSPQAEEETLSCEPYGLDLEAPVRQRQGAEDRGLFDGDLFGPAEQTQDRFDLTFEHAGVTSSYHVLAQGVDWSRPVGVVFRLHGDGAWEFESPEYNVSCLAEVARTHNMILVVPRTPDRAGEITWWEEAEQNAAWFRALVEERLLQDYDIDRSRTWLTGYSGGAQLIARELLADHVDLVPGGGAILLGGGQAPSGAEARPTRGQLRDLRLHWDVGEDDDGTDPKAIFNALGAARDGYRWYAQAGYDGVELRVREGVDHFELPDARILDRVLTRAEEDSADESG